MSQSYTYPASVSTSPSTGINGSPAPTSSTEVGGIDPSGKLQGLKVDALGNLLVDIAQPLIISENISQFGGVNISTGTGASGAGIPRVTVANDSNILATQSGTWNLNNITGTVSLPTGAATAANQATEITSLATIATETTAIAGQLPATLGAHVTAASLAVNIASDQVVPVSASALPLPTGAATSALQTAGNASLVTIANETTAISGQLPATLGAHVTAASLAVNIASDQTVNVLQPDTMVTGVIMTTQTLSISTTGAGTVGVQVVGSWSGTILIEATINGTVWVPTDLLQFASGGTSSSITSNVIGQVAASGVEAIRLRGNTVTGAAVVTLVANVSAAVVQLDNPLPTGSNTIGSIANISGTVSLPTGASTAALQSNVQSTPGTSAATAITVQGSASGVAIPTTVASLPLPTGAATSALQTAGNSTLTTISGQLPSTLGAHVTAASVAVNIASDQTVPVSAAALPLPTGAATSALQTTGNTSLATIATNTTGAATAALQTTGNTSLSTIITDLTNGTQKSQIVDGSGNVIGSISSAGNALQVAQSATNFVASTLNSSTTQLAAGASFTGTIETAFNQQSFSILATSDQNGTLQVFNWIDAGGTRLAQTLTYAITAGVGFSQSGVINGNYVSVKFTNNGASTTTTFNLNVAYGTIPSATNLNNAPVSLNEVNGTALTLGQKTAALSIPVVMASGSTTSTSAVTAGTAISNAPVYNLYSSTNITTSAYVQLIASTTAATNTLHIFDSSGSAMILAVGASGSEVVQLYVPPGGDSYTLNIPAGSRIAYKALTANATAGYLLISLLQ